MPEWPRRVARDAMALPTTTRRCALATFAALACAPGARAQSQGPGRDGLRLRGRSQLRFWGLAIYDAALWTAEPFDPAEFAASPLRLELTYHRAFQSQAIVERSFSEMARGGPLPAERLPAWRAFLATGIPDVQPGQRLATVWTPQRHSTQLHGPGQAGAAALHELVDPDFGPRFLGIWLASNTSEPNLRRRLLGLP